LIQYVKDRPGHDRRYAIDSTKLRTTLGWRPTYEFERGLVATVQWYVENERWWNRVRTGQYQDYYDQQYGSRLQRTSG
jgi:dTDP-glucose 4,6-dehydratase